MRQSFKFKQSLYVFNEIYWYLKLVIYILPIVLLYFKLFCRLNKNTYNQLTGFYMMGTLVVKWLVLTVMTKVGD